MLAVSGKEKKFPDGLRLRHRYPVAVAAYGGGGALGHATPFGVMFSLYVTCGATTG